MDIEEGRVRGGGKRLGDQVGIALLDGVGEAESELAFAGADGVVKRAAMGVLAKRDRRGGIALAPAAVLRTRRLWLQPKSSTVLRRALRRRISG